MSLRYCDTGLCGLVEPPANVRNDAEVRQEREGADLASGAARIFQKNATQANAGLRILSIRAF